MDINQVVILILGWSLGFFNSVLIEKYLKRKKTKEAVIGINRELKDLQNNLVNICVLGSIDLKKTDSEWINWLNPYFLKLIENKEYELINNNDVYKNFSEKNKNSFLELLIKYYSSDPKLAKTTPTHIKMTTPFLDSKYEFLPFFKSEMQEEIMNIKKNLNVMNLMIDQVWYYHTKTFELENDNYHVAKQNITDCINKIVKRSKLIIDSIEKITN